MHVQQRRLAGAGSAGDQDVEARPDAAVEEVHGLRRERAEPDEVVGFEPPLGELPDREQRPGQRQRREHRVHAAAVGQARVHHGRATRPRAGRPARPSSSMIRRRCESSVKRTSVSEELALALDPDLVGPLTMISVIVSSASSRSSGPWPRMSSVSSRDEPLAVAARDPGLRLELVRRCRHARRSRSVLGVGLGVEELRPEAADDGLVDRGPSPPRTGRASAAVAGVRAR